MRGEVKAGGQASMLKDWSDMAFFVRVVQEGGFTAAARTLGVPKARVSRKVQELEARLGTPLLKRTTRTLGLTEAGHAYFEQCARLVREMDELEQTVADLGARPRGWLRITATPWLAIDVLARILPAFRAQYPDIMLDVLTTHEPLDVVSLDVDIAFRLWMGDLLLQSCRSPSLRAPDAGSRQHRLCPTPWPASAA